MKERAINAEQRAETTSNDLAEKSRLLARNERELATVKEDSQGSSRQISRDQHRLATVEAKLAQAENHVEKLQAAIDAKTDLLNLKEKELVESKGETREAAARLSGEKSHRTMLETQVVELREELASKAQDIAEIHAQYATQESERQKENFHHRQLQDDLIEAQENLGQLERALRTATEAVSAAEDARREQAYTEAELEKTIVSYKCQVEELNDMLAAQISAQETTKRDAGDIQQQLNDFQAAAEEATGRLAELENSLSLVTTDKAELEKMVEVLTNEQKHDLGAMESLRVENNSLQEELMVLQSKMRRTTRNQETREMELQQKVTILSNKVEATESSLRQMDTLTKRLREENGILLSEKSSLTSALASSQRNKAHLRKEKHRLAMDLTAANTSVMQENFERLNKKNMTLNNTSHIRNISSNVLQKSPRRNYTDSRHNLNFARTGRLHTSPQRSATNIASTVTPTKEPERPSTSTPRASRREGQPKSVAPPPALDISAVQNP
eukprot:m.71539 g.71539  ORF g.71539 m.71539 type:complete len:502 (-) comp12255_c0_seq2:133-1638(-)